MHSQETIICTAAPQAANADHGAIGIHDFETGTSLVSFKHTNAGINCTALVESKNGYGGFVLSLQREKAILNVYSFQKDQIALKMILPEKLTCIAVDRRGDYCAGGTAHGRIHLWEVASGILYNSWDAHYQRVNVLRFTHDGTALLSGSEDSGVCVWSVSRLLDDERQSDIPAADCVFTEHTLPVTDIVCGVGAFPKCRMLSSSIDHTVKLWDLSSKTVLNTFEFPQPISCIVFDLAERFFFAASGDGSIHQMDIFRHYEDTIGVHAAHGSGLGDAIRQPDTPPTRKRLISLGEPVKCMSISLTSSHLVAGTSTGLIHIYDIPSLQLMRTISTHNGMMITHVATMLKPPDLIGHVSLSLSTSASTADMRDVLPIKPVMPFQRVRDTNSREAHEVSMLLPVQDVQEGDEYSAEELEQDYGFFVQPSPQTGDAATLQSKVTQLEAEVALLKDELGKAKGVNDMMWETVVQRVVNIKGKDGNMKVMDVDG